METSTIVYLSVGLILSALLLAAFLYRQFLAPIIAEKFPASTGGHGHGHGHGNGAGKPVSNIVHEDYIRHMEMGDVKPQMQPH